MPSQYRFGPFILDPAGYRLTRDGIEVPLSPRLIDLLAHLVAHPSELASKDVLLGVGWPDVAVSDNSLTQAISTLREALGDSSATPAYIQTVPRRGYRFVAAVETLHPEPVERAGTVPAAGRPREGRETSSLEAARAFGEGRWRLEALDANLVAEAIAHFERAVALDTAYVAAWLGLANARFWQYEATRDDPSPDVEALEGALAAARRAVALDPALAEARATMGYVLAGAGRMAEARAETERAVVLEPDYWAHHFRLGNALWGGARLRAHARALELYPEFAFAHLQSAMVHVARGDLGAAETSLREGILVRARHQGRLERFPARGLHWLLGLVRIALGDERDGRAELARECADDAGGLYAAEFVSHARAALGFVELDRGDAERARGAFRAVLAARPGSARALVGLTAAEVQRRSGEAESVRRGAEAAIAELRRQGREVEADLAAAAAQALDGDPDGACETISGLLVQTPHGSAGWLTPVDPALASLRRYLPFHAVLARVATRAE